MALTDGSLISVNGAVSGTEQAMKDATAAELVTALNSIAPGNATIVAADKVLFQDASDSDNLKQDDAQTLANLATPEGTVILSTGETTAKKFLREDGDNTCSWQDPRAIDVATYATSQVLTAEECQGYIVYVTGAATITLPAVAAGMSVTIITIGAVAVSVDPNASDKIWLDGTALDDGDKITNTSTAGDIAVLTYYSADGWYAATNSWTDGGA